MASTIVLDAADNAAIYGILGGLLSGFVNWSSKGNPPLENTNAYVKYYALFGSMGCISGALFYMVFKEITSPSGAGFFGGLFGSFVLLGVGNFL